jgi:DNA-binding response OmpR family regulator
MLKTHSRMSDLKAISLPSRQETLNLFNKEKFNLYIVDFQLQSMSGVEFCKDIRMLDAETPILIYTGAAGENIRAAGMFFGANACLMRPEVGEIVSTIKRLLEKS